ncbi:MAG: type II toxin-antitoxin system mRNA interferase toxin, RelE/StbE family, partial [archaeon]
MAYNLEVKPSLDKIFRKIGKRDPEQFKALRNKTRQILEDPYRFKPLSASMKNKRRVHVYGSFVLLYEI